MSNTAFIHHICHITSQRRRQERPKACCTSALRPDAGLSRRQALSALLLSAAAVGKALAGAPCTDICPPDTSPQQHVTDVDPVLPCPEDAGAASEGLRTYASSREGYRLDIPASWEEKSKSGAHAMHACSMQAHLLH